MVRQRFAGSKLGLMEFNSPGSNTKPYYPDKVELVRFQHAPPFSSLCRGGREAEARDCKSRNVVAITTPYLITGKRDGWKAQYAQPEHTQDAGGEGAMHPKDSLMEYSNQGECARLLTENEAGSMPATPANLLDYS